MTDHALITELLTKQLGLITRVQLADAGLSPGGIQYRLGTGTLQRVARGLYRSALAPETYEQALIAAVLSVDPDAVISHSSAAQLWGFSDIEPDAIHVTTRAARWRSREFVVHRSGDLGADHVTRVRGVPVTTAVRTILDISLTAPYLARSAFRQTIRDGTAGLDEFRSLLSDVARQGRHGVSKLREMIEERERWDAETDSLLEDEFIRVLDSAAIELPESQVSISDRFGTFIGRVDFAYPRQRLVIELDGYRFHSDPESFVHDRARQNALLMAGYRVLRYTSVDLRNRPDGVAAEISQALQARSQQ